MSATTLTLPAAPAGDTVAGAGRRPVVQSEVIDLLCCYREAIELADDHRLAERAV